MKKLFFVLSFLAFVPAAQAQMDCEEVPSCAELGYTQDSCAGGKGVRCPFDETKFYCSGEKQLPDAENPGVTDEDWSAECADKIEYCTAYNMDCQCTSCQEGYLLSNGACVPECDKSTDTCATESKIFNAETCTCETCPENYQFNSETKTCEQIACDKTKVEHCTTYSSDYEPCTCQACEANYLLVDGTCKKMCTVIANCTTYDSEYDPCNCTACEDGFTLKDGSCVSDCAEKCKIAYPLFAGQDNTNAAIDQIGNNALAAYAARQFYVGDKDGDFGQGKWYLPSIGELMYLWGTDTSKVTSSASSSGTTKNNKVLIDNALSVLADKGVEAAALDSDDLYWSSSEAGANYSWQHYTGRSYNKKAPQTARMRCVMILKKVFSGDGVAPQIGDVMYSDKTYGAASDYNSSKTPVGIIASVSKEKQDVMIINLKDLKFSSTFTTGNFNPDKPYKGTQENTYWCTSSKGQEDISKIPNISYSDIDENNLILYAKAADNCPCQFYKPACELDASTCAAQNQAFNEESCACEDCPENYQFNSETKACEKMACNLDVATCAAQTKAFNEESCACEDCPSGYLFDSEVNECREACKKDVNECYEYDSEWADCKCVACYGYWRYVSYVGGNSLKGYCAEDFCSIGGMAGCSVSYCRQCNSTQSGVCDVCADGFTLENNKCIPPTGECIEGSVLYDDFNCYDPENAPADRTVIGIVYAARPEPIDAADPNNLYAISLSYTLLPWSENLADTETGCNSKTDGQANTDCIIAAGAEENSAAVYCSKYGVTDADKGKWFLPAREQLKNEQRFMCLIRHGISVVTGQKIARIGLPAADISSSIRYASIATSTESSYKSATHNEVARSSGGMAYEQKSQTRQTVYCIIDYKKYQ